ncbi:hypothetical protein RB598_005339 [Gaeumannomyces tritici]
MTSIDELFKSSGLPNKRKLDTVRDPNEIYKSAKLGGSSNGRHAQVEDEDEDMTEAGPAPPPEGEDDDDGEYGPTAPQDDEGDDEEGRFFGGGITRQEAEVLDYVEGADNEPAAADEKMDATWLRRTALAFEKKINRNAELRARHADEPARFIDSEADLDAAVRALSILAEHPSLYGEFARLGCAASLASLLAHDNADVALAAIQIVGELTGDDLGGGGGAAAAAATDADWSALVDALLAADLLPLLVSNLGRLDEFGDDDADREGVYRILEVTENLCSRPETAEVVARDEQLVRWLLARAAKDEGGGAAVSQNKQYAAEMLAILAQAAPANRARLAGLDAVEALLQLVAPYRARDPDKGDEAEYMENLFEALTCIVDEDTGLGRQKFVEAEGHALCLVLAQSSSSSSGKSARKARTPALRLLDHAVSRSREAGVCERVVEYGGLKTLFTLFMKIKTGSGGGGGGDSARALEHLISIFSWMLRLLPAESAERVRTLAKFVEKDYEKTTRLAALRREYATRVAAVDATIAREADAMGADAAADDAAAVDGWFSRRLDAGLFCLQTLDVILAWLAAEDAGVGRRIGELLADKGGTDVIKASLREQAEGVDTSTDDGKEMLDMLNTLADCID